MDPGAACVEEVIPAVPDAARLQRHFVRGVIIEIKRREEEGDVRERDVRHIGAEIPGPDVEQRERGRDREPAVVSPERETGEVSRADMKTGAADIPARDPAVAHGRLEFVVRVRERDCIGQSLVSAAVNKGAGNAAAPGEAVFLVSVVVVPGGVLGVNRQHNRRIALLHDIGRFQQLRLYNSFSPDTMDHAAFGVQLLFEGENPMISRFIEDRSYDDIIRVAIARHSDFRLEGIQDERILFHAKMIRDADKLDNCRVKLVDSVEAMIGVPQEHAGEGKISPKVWESCLRKEAVSSPDRITSVDYWVSYAAQYYDLNFKETWRIMKEKDYISRIIKRLEYKEKDTREKMEILEQQMNAYMEKILC